MSRIAKLAENSGFNFEDNPLDKIYSKEIEQTFEEFRFNDILQHFWLVQLSLIDKHIDHNSPWLIKDKDKLKSILQEEINMLKELAQQIEPFLPETSQKIRDQFKGPKITSAKPLFPRI